MIDVIIPTYNAYDTIERTLKSIECQTIKDKLKVYIIDDCSIKDYNYLKDLFDLDITIYRLSKNGGPGVAREYGIEHSNSEYIVFIDSDDIFSSSDSIKIMFNTIGDKDVGVTAFTEEYDVGGYTIYDDNIWMHGKIYKRKYIIDNDIHFNDSRQNEDYGFNRLLILSGATINYSRDITYIWKNNKASITRKNNYEYDYEGLFGYMYNVLWVLKLSKERNYNKNLIGSLAYESLVFMYINYLRFNRIRDMHELLNQCKKVLDIYKENKLDSNNEKEIYTKVTTKYYGVILNCNLDVSITFDIFMSNIVK